MTRRRVSSLAGSIVVTKKDSVWSSEELVMLRITTGVDPAKSVTVSVPLVTGANTLIVLGFSCPTGLEPDGSLIVKLYVLLAVAGIAGYVNV